MNREVNSLLLKSNRILGTRLVEVGLVQLADIDKANETFVARVRSKEIERASLLRILVYEEQSLMENDLLEHQIETFGLGAALIDHYNVDIALFNSYPSEILRATWTIPLESVQGHTFLATAYYMSDIVRQYWEEKIVGDITWYVCPVNQIESFLEEQESKRKTTESEEES